MKKTIYILFGIICLAFIVAGFTDFAMGTSILLALFFPACFLVFLHKIDVFEREKFKDILLVFMLGIVTCALTFMFYPAMRDALFGSGDYNLIDMFIGVAIPEEIIKIIPVLIILKKTKFINEPIDYLIYSSASALAFAFIENITYIYDYKEGGGIVAVRSLMPSIMHMVTTSLIGIGLFFYRITKQKKHIFIFFIIACLAHAVYNVYLSHIFLIIYSIYYAGFINDLMNISPFYNKEKIKEFNKNGLFLLRIILAVCILDLIFTYYYTGAVQIKNYIWLAIAPYIIYSSISSEPLIKGKISIFSKTQKDILNKYYTESTKK